MSERADKKERKKKMKSNMQNKAKTKSKMQKKTTAKKSVGRIKNTYKCELKDGALVETIAEVDFSEYGKPTYEDLVKKLKHEGEVRNILLKKVGLMTKYAYDIKRLIDKNAYGKAMILFCDMYRYVEEAMEDVTEENRNSEE